MLEYRKAWTGEKLDMIMQEWNMHDEDTPEVELEEDGQ